MVEHGGTAAGAGWQVVEELVHRNGAITLEWESLLDSIAGKCN